MRINAQLVETQNGRNLWAERFEAPLDNMFEIQDEIAASVANALAARIDTARLGRARRQPLTSLEAYDCWLRGFEGLRQGTLESDLEARPFFERALELDPHFARAYAGLSLSHFNEWSCQAWHLWDENESKAYDYACRAVELDESDALVHVVLGRVLLYRREFDDGEKHLDRALALTPNYADVLAQVAIGKYYLGSAEQAHALALKAARLNPLHDDWYYGMVGLPLFSLRRYEEALEFMLKAGASIVDFPAYRAAAAALSGNEERARRDCRSFLSDFVAKITFGRAPDPGEPLDWVLRVNPLRRIEDALHLTEGLRRAGLEEPGVNSFGQPSLRGVRPAALPLAGNVFRCDGQLWTVAFDGAGARLVELKGFGDLAQLLSQPHKPIHCLELFGAPLEPGKADEVLDRRARSDYHRRISELQMELEEAEAFNDLGRAERARVELDTLVDALSKAMGLHRRSRKLGDPAERARSAVTWRIRSAIKKIQAAHPRLGQHLLNSVRTGTFCTYSPENNLNWQL
ncbi:MAG: hypothetical protein WD696_15990 [Bryobacteraceae bacterium]